MRPVGVSVTVGHHLMEGIMFNQTEEKTSKRKRTRNNNYDTPGADPGANPQGKAPTYKFSQKLHGIKKMLVNGKGGIPLVSATLRYQFIYFTNKTNNLFVQNEEIFLQLDELDELDKIIQA